MKPFDGFDFDSRTVEIGDYSPHDGLTVVWTDAFVIHRTCPDRQHGRLQPVGHQR